jgi:hypothetical protein
MKTKNINQKGYPNRVNPGPGFRCKLVVIVMFVQLFGFIWTNSLQAQTPKHKRQSAQVQPAPANSKSPAVNEPPHSPPLMDIEPDAKPGSMPPADIGPAQESPAPAPRRHSGKPH